MPKKISVLLVLLKIYNSCFLVKIRLLKLGKGSYPFVDSKKMYERNVYEDKMLF